MINQRKVRELLKKFQVHLLMDWIFCTFPREKKVGDFVYPVNSLEAWLVEKEIFQQQIYAGVFDLSAVRSFADLGCNRGFFSLWLAANTSPNLDGILVEANPHLIPLIDKLLRKNNLQQLHVRNGLVGAGPDGRECEILIPPTDVGAGLASTTRDSLAGDVCETVRVPALNFAKLWSETFPDGRSCDLLKIDIEGAEARFFDDEAEFLSRVRQLVVEVHKRMVPLDEFRETLRRRGFKIVHERSDDSETSLIFAKNNSA